MLTITITIAAQNERFSPTSTRLLLYITRCSPTVVLDYYYYYCCSADAELERRHHGPPGVLLCTYKHT